MTREHRAHECTHAEAAALAAAPDGMERLAAGVHAIVARVDPSVVTVGSARSLPVVVVGVAEAGHAAGDRVGPDLFDVVVPESGLAAVLAAIERHPLSAVTLALLLRQSESLPVDEALVAESTAYSMLQGGPEHAAWAAARPAQVRPADSAPAVRVARVDDELSIELDRPRRHNAFDRLMRDQLSEALIVAASDPSITAVHLSGRGPSFCSGGDLVEFGSRPDPATAHVTRLSRSPGRLIHGLADRLHVRIHGACIGAGIEMPSFAGHVTAAADAAIGLPELELGLIPGAGGTVSLPRRIGRQRTTWLAISGERLDAATALRWGLVDELA